MGQDYTVRTLSPIRKVIARRMSEVVASIPHYRLMVEIEVDAIQNLRRHLCDPDTQSRPSLNDLIIKACASALMDVPAVNVQWAGNHIHQFHTANISFVTAFKDGLATPIIWRAETKSVWQISCEVKELRAKAATHTLRMEDVDGGSFSISNLGMYGVDQFDALINPPQCAMLAVGCAKSKRVVSESGQSRTASVLRATLACDHRAIDGVLGASFLSAFRKHVEHPGQLGTR